MKQLTNTRGKDSGKDSEALPFTDPEKHYHVAASVKEHCDVNAFVSENADDPAFHDFIPKLKDHLLSRILGDEWRGERFQFQDAERRDLYFVNNRLYNHQAIRFNYTTYDMRRDQDSVSPSTHPDVMVLSHEDDGKTHHPYWYARVLLIFHVFAQYRDIDGTLTRPVRMDVLWVRWFGRNLWVRTGWKAKRLHQVGFLPVSDPGAFDFLDPDLVIRAIQLIPRFVGGRTTMFLGRSIVRPPDDNDEDWLHFYVNMFVDRDIVMRFRGDGVGHKSTREATQCLREDRDPLDESDQADAPDDETVIEVVPNGHGSDEEGAEDNEDDEDNENSDSDDYDNSENDPGEEPLDEYDAEGYAEL